MNINQTHSNTGSIYWAIDSHKVFSSIELKKEKIILINPTYYFSQTCLSMCLSWHAFLDWSRDVSTHYLV